MPLTPSPAFGPRRRSMLAGTLSALTLLGGGAVGCSASDAGDAAGPADPRAQRRLRQAAVRRSHALLGRYDATLAVHSGLAERLRPLRLAVARHVETLERFGGGARDLGGRGSGGHGPGSREEGGRSGDGHGAQDHGGGNQDAGERDTEERDASERDAGAPGAGRAPGTGEPGRAAAVPHDQKAALTALARAEKRTADAHTTSLTGASPDLARLLASIAAAGAAHAYLLGADGPSGNTGGSGSGKDDNA
jgi:hypothetical protein